ncbi:Uncharacterised protein [Klebsiella quasivariicola]|nr:Uncharacterised protein [Klebsiella quasivariicola]
MNSVNMWESNGSDEEQEFKCLSCGCSTSEADFESVDDEFNPQHPRCPDCQRWHRISRETCDCGQPAAHEVELGFVCDECYEHYVSGYIRD